MKKTLTFFTKKLSNLSKGGILSLASFLVFGTSVMAQSPYCNPDYNSQSGNCTTYSMSVNAVDIKSGSTSIYNRAHNSGGYNGCTNSTGQYTLWSTTSMFNLKIGATYSIGFTTGPSYNVGVGVWLDLNADNDFADAGEWLSTGWCTPYLTPGSSTLQYFNLAIPAGATAGTTRMRIRTTYSSCTNNDNGCTTYNYGEAEDYTVTLTSLANDAGITNITAPKCGPSVVTTLTNLGNNSISNVSIGWMVDGVAQTVNNYNTALAVGKSANITLSPDYNFVDAQAYTLKVFSYSPNSTTDADKTNDTMVIKFTYASPAPTPKPKDVTRCGGGSVVFNAGVPKNTSALWYNSSTSTNFLAVDTIYKTPFLNPGSYTYYVESAKLGSASSLGTAMAGGYWFGRVASGNMFDIKSAKTLMIDSLAINVNHFTTVDVNIYVKTGTYQGYQSNSAAWTLIKSFSGVAAKGLGNKTTVPMGGYILPAGTFGVYVQISDGIIFNAGTTSYSNSDLTLTFGDAITGSFGGIASSYSWSGFIYYRPLLCISSRVAVNATVKPSPSGAAFTKGTTFQTTRPNSLGTISDPDIVANGDQLSYELTPPTGYINSGYGSKWLTSSLTLKSKSGTVINPAYYSWSDPSGSSPGKLSFSPDSKLTDTFIVVSLQIRDLGPHFCDSTILRHIFVAPRPNPDFRFNNPVCDGDAVVFDNLSTITSGGLTYRWDFGTGNPADTSDAYTTVFTFPTYGDYKVSLRTRSLPYGYEETKVITVAVTEIPRIDFKVLNACEKVAVSFNNNTTHSGTVTYAWEFGDPTTTADKSSLKSPKWTYTAPGAYKVTLKATASGCTSELTKNANQFATPVAKYTAPSLICDKTEVQFTNGSSIKYGNMGYTWDFSDGGVSNVANPIHEFANSTTKSVKMKAVSEFGCVDSMIKVLTLQESPKADFSWGAACNLTNTVFNFTGTQPSGTVTTTFNWDFSGEGTTTLQNPSKLFSVVGKKMVSLNLISNNGCSDVITKEVNVKLQSKADFDASDVCEDDDAVFVNKSQVSAGNLNYNWKFGDASNSGSQSPRHRYTINGVSKTFNVTLVALVPGGCSDSVTKAVSVNANPNAGFTYTRSGRLVYFKASETGATLYQWRFGDGGSATTASPQYQYLNFPSGNYTACLAVVNAAGCFSETCQTIAISSGIDKLTKLSGVKVYPNPNKGNFTVTVEDPKSDISIAVYNLLGELVSNIETNSLKSTYAIDLNVANGVYMVKVTNGGLTSTQKVTVNK